MEKFQSEVQDVVESKPNVHYLIDFEEDTSLDQTDRLSVLSVLSVTLLSSSTFLEIFSWVTRESLGFVNETAVPSDRNKKILVNYKIERREMYSQDEKKYVLRFNCHCV